MSVWKRIFMWQLQAANITLLFGCWFYLRFCFEIIYFYILGEGLQTGFDLLWALYQTKGDDKQKHCLLFSTLNIIERPDLLETLSDHLLYTSRGEKHEFVTLISPVLVSASLHYFVFISRYLLSFNLFGIFSLCQ